jgi:hypothetical protein
VAADLARPDFRQRREDLLALGLTRYPNPPDAVWPSTGNPFLNITSFDEPLNEVSGAGSVVKDPSSD